MRRLGKIWGLVVVCVMMGVGMGYGDELRVTVTNVKPSKGFLMVTLVDSEKNWEQAVEGKAGSKGIRAKAGGARSQEIIFGGVEGSGLREGRYGVLIFQDVDGDGELKKGLFGIPQEPVGVSNNTPLFGPPKFKDAKIRLKEGESSIEVILR